MKGYWQDDIPGADGRPERRLVDTDGRANGEEWGIELLREAAPTNTSAFRKQRIRLALDHRGVHRAPFALRAVIIVSVLVCAAAASGALAHWRTVGPHGLPPGSAAERRIATVPRTAEVQAPPMSRATAPGARGRAPVSPARALEAPHAKPVTAVGHTEDTSAVSEAMRALRICRDPVRARRLARQYLDRYPSGTLAEEALAITIEAAAHHHDADAAAFGKLYLRLYPFGFFRARAQRTAGDRYSEPHPSLTETAPRSTL